VGQLIVEPDPANPPQQPATRDDANLSRRLDILKLFGTIDFDPAWDYKAERRCPAELR
jgi:hypothetical protein